MIWDEGDYVGGSETMLNGKNKDWERIYGMVLDVVEWDETGWYETEGMMWKEAR